MTSFSSRVLGIIILAIQSFTGSLYTQVKQDWVAIYNGPGNGGDVASSLAFDGLGNVYVTGLSGLYPNTDYVTIKYNSSGDSLWVARYNGTGSSYDAAFSITVDASGNVYVTGYSVGSGTVEDYATIKYNSSGVQQWVARYNGPGNGTDVARSIAVDGTGNVYVTGGSRGSATERDYATIKYNSSGVQQWVARYIGPTNGYAEAFSIAVDGSGNVYVTGESIGNGTWLDYTTIKYNSSGIQEWVQRYNGPGNNADYAYSLSLDGSGNVYVTGQSRGVSGTGTDYATIKYNSSGVQQWAQRYHGPAGDSTSINVAWSLAVDGSGNVYVTGQSTGIGTSLDYATIKYNSSGVQQWVARYNGPPGNSGDVAWSLAVDGSGNVYVTGESYGTFGMGLDYATIKYNSSGVQQWVQRYNGPGIVSDAAYSLAVDGSGNVYVTGKSLGSGTGYDYATIKYSQPVGITPISNEIPDRFSLSQNYPNPFNPVTKIRFDIPSNPEYSSNVKMVIYDILGRKIAVLVNEELKPGTYEVEWNAINYSSEVYYYELVSGEFRQTNKMILIK